MGAIDAEALGPFVKQAHGHGVHEMFFCVSWLRTVNWRRRHGGASHQTDVCRKNRY